MKLIIQPLIKSYEVFLILITSSNPTVKNLFSQLFISLYSNSCSTGESLIKLLFKSTSACFKSIPKKNKQTQ